MACEVVAISGIEFHKLALTDAFGEPLDEQDQDQEEFDDEQNVEEKPPDSSPQLPELVSSDNAPPKRRKKGWLGFVVKQLSSWMTVHEQTSMIRVLSAPDLEDEYEDEELWTEWEWIVSETEKAAAKWSEEESKRVKEELAVLRKSANFLKSRPAFMSSARIALIHKKFQPDEMQLLQGTELDSNKRSKIISDVVMAFADGWLQMILDLFFHDKSKDLQAAYRESYYEGPYRKGAIGGLKEVGWQASHGPGGSGLTPQVLGDILWALWKGLMSSVRFALDEELDNESMKAMVDGVCGCQDSIIDLWYCTVRNSEFGAQREGLLPERWSIEDKQKQERLEDMKRRGMIDARYETKTINTLEGGSVVVEPLMERKQLDDLKRLLESSLHFYVIDH